VLTSLAVLVVMLDNGNQQRHAPFETCSGVMAFEAPYAPVRTLLCVAA
jgi:hypothetical protein